MAYPTLVSICLVLAGFFITPSHRCGQLGLLERENAAVLSAALQPLAARLLPAYSAALAACGVSAPLLLTANDGTLVTLAAAEQVPAAGDHGPMR
jgi:N-methylhydantoinase A/oxoprolinase/acetone carboxylase beta subunit